MFVRPYVPIIMGYSVYKKKWANFNVVNYKVYEENLLFEEFYQQKKIEELQLNSTTKT